MVTQSSRTSFFAPLSRNHGTSLRVLDVDRPSVMRLIVEPHYERGIDLLEGIVAMLTKMTA